MSFRLKVELKRLCCNNGWSYGVFWRVHRRNSLLLTLEDAYYGEQMGLVINKMLPRVHVLGEGIVGQAAFTGKHHWFFLDAYYGERSSKGHVAGQNIFQVQDNSDFHHQFSSGIKTVAVISVAPQGVIQFGSTEKILESLEFVDHTRSLFRQIERADELVLSGNALRDSSGEVYDPCGSFSSAVLSGNSYSHYRNIEPLHDDSCKELMAKSNSSSFTPEWHHVSMSTLIGNQFHLKSQYNMAGAEAQVILSKPCLQLPQVLSESYSSCTDNTVGRHQTMSSLSGEGSTMTSFERPLLCGSGICVTPKVSSATLNTPVSSKNVFVDFQGESTFPPLCSMGRSHDMVSELVDIQPPTHLTHSTEDELRKVPSSFPAFTGVSRSFNTMEAVSEPNPVHNLSQLDVPPLGQGNNGLAPPTLNDNLSQSVVLPGDILNQAVTPATNNINSYGAVCDWKGNSSNVPMQLPTENELFDSLGLDFGSFQSGESWGDVILPLGTGGYPTLSTGISESISEVVPQKGFFSEGVLENMLNDVVCSFNSVTKPSSHDSRTTIARTGSTSEFWNQIQLAGLSCLGGNMDVMLPECNNNMLGTQKEIVAKSQVGSWIDDSYSINVESAVVTQPKRTEEPTKVTKKRARPGETTRPRPKDRQQIQDRVKELREIVPNGAKCSIDALLDRTIKHMLFLQSVTKYADQLKQADEPQIIGDESCVILKDNLSGGGCGATWAFEVGGQTLVCPIIVEELRPPGQMLIEMLCEERGFFLEIADIIRGFGLTILKGVMEAREDKLWARFVIEANKEITRMDIFLSLVQLLQQTVSSGVGSGNQLT
ncbi:transcription factor LHW-like isoform X2 [Telopea speciosissima]|uniref:transcription factor LHW-like isoform X2 n=1 Tax=Telopea speciosissima TaxID=54955 RepID=UPI001CC7A3AE|nr:transcription factor LHW-like isoform X2 [Telopea speciosissima]